MRIPQRVEVLPLLSPLHGNLMELYGALSPEQWSAPTVCAKLSSGRDGHRRPPEKAIADGPSLIDYLNELNEGWVSATRRLSPAVLTELQALSGPQVVSHWHSVDMDSMARVPVGWAGEDSSQNWFDCAREYTERWHHQQQIRDAVGAEPLTARKWLAPILATFMRSLPVAYRGAQADEGTRIAFNFTGEAGSQWTLERGTDNWILYEGRGEGAVAVIRTDADTAWRIFTKGITPHQASDRTAVEGRREFREPFLQALAVMAKR